MVLKSFPDYKLIGCEGRTISIITSYVST